MINVQVNTSTNISQSTQSLSDNAVRIGLIFAGWLALFFFMGWVSRHLIPQFRTFTPKEKSYWQLAMVRAIAGMLTPWAVYIAFVDERIGQDHVLASTDESWSFLSTSIGFFTFDVLILIYLDIQYRTFSKALHVHHLFAFSGHLLSAFSNRGHYYVVNSFILETTTPFSCICWCLLKLKCEKTKMWKINQWILIYLFHFRSAYELWWWYDIYVNWDNIKQNFPLLGTIHMLSFLIVATFWLTPYWTYKKTIQYFDPRCLLTENVKEQQKDAIDKKL